MNLDLALSLMIALATHASEIGALITKAKSENRDLTLEEVRALLDSDAASAARLANAIAQAKAAGH